MQMKYLETATSILGSALSLGSRAGSLSAETQLMGSLPEFDSMTVVSVLTMIEEELGTTIADEDVSAEDFATVGAVANLIERLRLGK